MSKTDAEIIKMMLWAIMCKLSTNPTTAKAAFVIMCLHGILAVVASFMGWSNERNK